MVTSSGGSGDLRALRLSQERPAATQNGYVMLLVLLALFIGGIVALSMAVSGRELLGGSLFGAAVLAFLFVSVGF